MGLATRTLRLAALLDAGAGLVLVATPGVMVKALGLGEPFMVKLLGIALLALGVGAFVATLRLGGAAPARAAMGMGIIAHAGFAAVLAFAGSGRAFIMLAPWLVTALWGAAIVAFAIALGLALACVAQRRAAVI